MPRTCTVCTHPQKAAIDKGLIAGTPLRTIAEHNGLSATALHRHKEDHLPKALVKAHEREDVREALDVVAQLRAINGASLNILKEARASGANGLALQAVDRVHKQIELQAKLLGELDERPVINILMAPEWLVVRAALFSALQPYTEARAAVAGALLQLEAGG